MRRRPVVLACVVAALAGVTLLAATITDSFTRADNADLGADWTPPSNVCAMEIVGNEVRAASGSDFCAEYYSTGTWGTTHTAQVIVATSYTGTSFYGCGAATNISTDGDFYMLIGNTDRARLMKIVNGAFDSVLYEFSAFPVINGQELRLDSAPSGGNTVLSSYLDDVLMTGSSVTDSTSAIQGGAAGMACEAPTPANAELDSFEGTGWTASGGGGGAAPRLMLLGVGEHQP